jgi:hypothetical protein
VLITRCHGDVTAGVAVNKNASKFVLAGLAERAQISSQSCVVNDCCAGYIPRKFLLPMEHLPKKNKLINQQLLLWPTNNYSVAKNQIL